MKLIPIKLTVAAIVAAAALTTNLHAYVGSTTPKLHVSGRFLQDSCNKNVLLHGWMQPTASWFNGEGNRYRDPNNWNECAKACKDQACISACDGRFHTK